MSTYNDTLIDTEAIPTPDELWDRLSHNERDYWTAAVNLFPAPPLVIRLALDNDSIEAYDPAALSSKVSTDPILAGRIISRANSAAFGLRSPIVSLQRAVVQLGYNLVRGTIMRYAIENSVQNMNGLEVKWILVIQGGTESGAVIAWHWARLLGLKDASELATRCLLCRLGTFLLARRFPTKMNEYFSLSGEIDRLYYEAEQFHLTTPALTSRVSAGWSLPEVMQKQLLLHWQPLVEPVSDISTCIASASTALSFDPPRYMDQIRKWLALPAHAQLAANLEACGAMAKLPSMLSSEAYHRDMSALDS